MKPKQEPKEQEIKVEVDSRLKDGEWYLKKQEKPLEYEEARRSILCSTDYTNVKIEKLEVLALAEGERVGYEKAKHEIAVLKGTIGGLTTKIYHLENKKEKNMTEPKIDDFENMSKENFIKELEEEHFRDWKVLYDTIERRTKAKERERIKGIIQGQFSKFVSECKIAGLPSLEKPILLFKDRLLSEIEKEGDNGKL